MSATCAVCLQPIVARQDVRISGTEVMHRSCAMTGGETVGWRQQKEIADLRSQLVHAQENARRALAAQQQQIDRTTGSLSQLVQANSELALAQSAMEGTAATLAAVTRERDALRAEIAKRPVAPPPSEPAQEEYGKDAETRFSLLELDPL